jgi:hypothetical protein
MIRVVRLQAPSYFSHLIDTEAESQKTKSQGMFFSMCGVWFYGSVTEVPLSTLRENENVCEACRERFFAETEE